MMNSIPTRKPPLPNIDVPEEFEPGSLPVEPDEGPVPALIPDDPEYERVIEPGASRVRLPEPIRQPEVESQCV